jgi:ribosomal protein L40E
MRLQQEVQSALDAPPAMKLHCTQCGTPAPPGARFCPRCGTALPAA